MVVDGRPVPGGIFDFALYFFHNAAELLARGSGPYFYLPKMQSHLEARLWNDVFLDAQVRSHSQPGGSPRPGTGLWRPHPRECANLPPSSQRAPVFLRSPSKVLGM